MSFLVCFVLLSVGFTVGFGVAWLRGLRLRMFVGRLFGELRAGRVFVIPLGDRFMWGGVDRELHRGVSVGRLKEKVVGHGYDFSKLVLRNTGDVESLVEQLNCRGSLGMFVDDDLLKVEG